jgi:hypothetical protein
LSLPNAALGQMMQEKERRFESFPKPDEHGKLTERV